MSSDSSFPHSSDRRASSPAPPRAESPGAQVLEFPTDELSSPGQPVPAGTWASVDEAGNEDPSRSTDRPVTRRAAQEMAQVVAFPRNVGTHKRRRAEPPAARESSGTQRTQTPRIGAPVADVPPVTDAEEVELPAFLASELLKQDWYPKTPLCRSLRWGALGIGATGAIGVLGFGGLSAGALVLVGLLAACALAGALPLNAERRGVALAILGLAGTGCAGWMRMEGGHDPAALLLVGCITLSASALFFRAAHRTSRFARTLVGVGLAATAAWLVLTGSLDALVVESLAWQDWISPASRIVLGLVVVATLLTFVDPTGHGGAWAAGGSFLGWMALDTAGVIALAAWPARGAGAIAFGHPAWLATLAFPFLAALTAGGLCQVWVLASRAPAGRREAPSRATLA